MGGFGCRVTAGGAKAFILDYRVKGTGRQRRITLGRFPSWSVSAARDRARHYAGRLTKAAIRAVTSKPSVRRRQSVI